MVNSEEPRPKLFKRIAGRKDLSALREHITAEPRVREQFLKLVDESDSLPERSSAAKQQQERLLSSLLEIICRSDVPADLIRALGHKDPLVRGVALVTIEKLRAACPNLAADVIARFLKITYGVDDVSLTPRMGKDAYDTLMMLVDDWLSAIEDLVNAVLVQVKSNVSLSRDIDPRDIMLKVEDEFGATATKEFGCDAHVDPARVEEHDWGWIICFVPANPDTVPLRDELYCLVDRLTLTIRPLRRISLATGVHRAKLLYSIDAARLQRESSD